MPALKRIRLKGFKSIREMDLELKPINVLVGQNGAGKSNFIGFFRLLNEIIQQRLQIYVAESGGADAFLHYGEKTTRAIQAALYFGNNGYLLELIPTAEDALVFNKEELFFAGDYKDVTRMVGRGNRETKLLDAIKNKDSLAHYVVPSLQSWKVYHFHDTSVSAPVKKTGDIHDNEFLRSNAENLAAFLYLLQHKYPQHYTLIRATIQRVFPLFGDFLLRPNPLNEDKIRLEWSQRDSGYRFGPHQMSDGTLRFICLTTLLLQPNLPSTILIDEPELGLHPAALEILGGLVRTASTRTQVILSTQSVTFLNEFQPEDIITVDREDGVSVFNRHTTEELKAWLNDYSLSDIWEKNIIGGRP